MERPHAPTPRRRALARAAGRVLTSPALSTGLALAAGAAVAIVAAAATARSLARATRDQLAHAGDEDAITRATTAAATVPTHVLAAAAPVIVAAAIGAWLGQVAVARGLWIPVRTVRGAPAGGADATSAGGRAADAVVSIVRALIVAIAGTAVVLSALPGLAALSRTRPADGAAITSDRASLAWDSAAAASAFGAVAGAALAAVAIAAVATAMLELVVRHRRLARELAMTDRELRDDARETHGDPAIRRHRRAARDDDRAIIAGARVVVTGDALAVALAWPPGDRPRPLRIARDLDARRVLSAARHARVPIVADASLARTLAAAPAAVPDAALGPVAALLAAVGVRA